MLGKRFVYAGEARSHSPARTATMHRLAVHVDNHREERVKPRPLRLVEEAAHTADLFIHNPETHEPVTRSRGRVAVRAKPSLLRTQVDQSAEDHDLLPGVAEEPDDLKGCRDYARSFHTNTGVPRIKTGNGFNVSF